jgi:hypothetical protein
MDGGYMYHSSYLLDLWIRMLISYVSAALTAAAVYFAARPRPPGPRRAAVCVPVAAALLAVPAWVVDGGREAAAVTPVVGIFSLAAFKVGGRAALAFSACALSALCVLSVWVSDRPQPTPIGL